MIGVVRGSNRLVDRGQAGGEGAGRRAIYKQPGHGGGGTDWAGGSGARLAPRGALARGPPQLRRLRTGPAGDDGRGRE